MYEFQTAAEAAAPELTDSEETFDFTLANQEFRAKYPDVGQLSVLIAAKTTAGRMIAVHRLLGILLLDDGYDRINELLTNGQITFGTLFGGDELNERGILDTMIQVAIGRPTQPSSDSGQSQRSAGRKSTGRSPGKGSTHSNSRPTDSPT